ncbi:MAG: HD domain-containing protein, partial [Proteobacteria bacterium]|nr:HD domain-containing protein [Pseudomonadota bacterium]
GFEVVQAIRENILYKDIPVVMVTALSAKKDRLKAVACGANDFISKPIDSIELKVRIASLIQLKGYHDEIRRHQENLEEMVNAKTKALKMALTNLHSAQESTIKAHLETLIRLSVAAEFKDEDTAQHLQRMSRYSGLIATKFGLSDDDVDLILNASPMHDIGKIGIRDAILLKPSGLDREEWETMKTHTRIGCKILDSNSSSYLAMAKIIAQTHHEKWDGTGYPAGLAGEDIPLFGRICAIADVFDALTSARPYKKAFSNDEALAIMREGRGTHFQPELLDIFLDNLDLVVAIQTEHQD